MSHVQLVFHSIKDSKSFVTLLQSTSFLSLLAAKVNWINYLNFVNRFNLLIPINAFLKGKNHSNSLEQMI